MSLTRSRTAGFPAQTKQPSNNKTMKTRTKLALTTGLLAATAQAQISNFDDATSGAAPPGWTATQTGEGKAKWTIEKDATAPSKPNVLKQSGEASYPVCLKNATSLKDGFVVVKF